MVTPLLIPAVGNQPVIFTIFSSPTKKAHSVTSKLATGDMLVHARLVCWEIFIHCEGHRCRSILHDILLNFSNAVCGTRKSTTQIIGRRCFDFVIFVLPLILGFGALALQSRSVILAAGAWWAQGAKEYGAQVSPAPILS